MLRIKLMKGTFYFFVLLTLTVTAGCKSEKLNGGGGHFRSGYDNYSLSSINDCLSDKKLQIRKNFISFEASDEMIQKLVEQLNVQKL